MSDLLFPQAARHPLRLRLRLAALAAVMSVLAAIGAGWLGLSYLGIVGGGVRITAQVTTLGAALGVDSSVKYRGLRIGRIVTVDNTRSPDGTFRVSAVLDPSEASFVPRNVVARVVPGSIFGAEYIDLIPRGADPGSLASGQTVPADTSAQAIQVMQTLGAAQHILAAVDPATLQAAMSQFAKALDGRGSTLNQVIRQADGLLGQAHVHEPALYNDLNLLVTNLQTSADVEPVLAQAIRASLPTAAVITAHAKALASLLRGSTGLLDQTATFLQRNGAALDAFFAAVAPTYRAFVGGIAPFTQILQRASAVLFNGANAIRNHAIQMNAYFQANPTNPYTYKDCPRYGAIVGSNCR